MPVTQTGKILLEYRVNCMNPRIIVPKQVTMALVGLIVLAHLKITQLMELTHEFVHNAVAKVSFSNLFLFFPFLIFLILKFSGMVAVTCFYGLELP